ncbi:MAG: YciI family protein [Chloroflexi bacterium]|nr:YciI family protein [Chloroflexota bacterium]
MRYLMLVCVDPDHTTADVEAAPSLDDWDKTIEANGEWVLGDRFRPTSEARTVRVRAGELLVNDGPFTESKEWIAGFDVIEAPDMDAAIAIAAGHPQAYGGRIEVRPFWPLGDSDRG